MSYERVKPTYVWQVTSKYDKTADALINWRDLDFKALNPPPQITPFSLKTLKNYGPLFVLIIKKNVEPITDKAQTALFKDPVRTAL